MSARRVAVLCAGVTIAGIVIGWLAGDEGLPPEYQRLVGEGGFG